MNESEAHGGCGHSAEGTAMLQVHACTAGSGVPNRFAAVNLTHTYQRVRCVSVSMSSTYVCMCVCECVCMYLSVCV
jgi:hypothetical protein